MKPNKMIPAYAFCAICILVPLLATHAMGQSVVQENNSGISWQDSLSESSFPVSELDFSTKLKWFGLGIVAPQRLDNIVGFFAYPAEKVCKRSSFLPEEWVLVVNNAGGTQAWLGNEIIHAQASVVPSSGQNNGNIDPAGQLIDFCGQIDDSDLELIGDVYLGFGQELYWPGATKEIGSPVVFWSTYNAGLVSREKTQ